MACDLTAGRAVGCRDSIGGIKQVWFLPEFSTDAYLEIEQTANVITDLDLADWDIYPTVTAGTTVKFYRYNLRPDLSSMTIAVQNDVATGSVMFQQTLNLVLQGITTADLVQIEAMAKGRPQVFILDNNEQVYLLGLRQGMSLTAGDTFVTGAARTDMSGLNLTLTGMEQQPAWTFPAAANASGTNYPFGGLTDETAVEQILT